MQVRGARYSMRVALFSTVCACIFEGAIVFVCWQLPGGGPCIPSLAAFLFLFTHIPGAIIGLPVHALLLLVAPDGVLTVVSVEIANGLVIAWGLLIFVSKPAR